VIRNTSFARRGLCALTLVCAGLFAGSAHAAWSLVWSDEFNGSTLDSANWTIDVGNGCPDLCGWGNNELQWYRPENVTVTGGNLVLTAKAENYGPNQFTSGKVLTRDKQSFRYGRIEMRAKLPSGDGLWPAFWMMPQDDAYGGWAASGEIDIMESANAMTQVSGALHFGGSWPNNTYTSSATNLGGTSYADDFHVYAVEWEPDEMRWYIDGELFMTRVSSQWYTDAAPGDPNAPFDQPFYIILNTAVGGWYPGCTDPGCITPDLPQDFLIDYVRVYEQVATAEPVVTITAPANGAVLPVGDVLIEATATDADGTIDRVEFYDGSTLLGTDATAPYTWLWPGVTDGCYTIVARAYDNLGSFGEDAVDVEVGDGCGRGPFFGEPFGIPTKIQAEDFDNGGPSIAYEDSDPGNNGGAYRTDEAVDIEATSDLARGYNVGWLVAGEWMDYTVDVLYSANYTIDVRVASLPGGGSFRIEFGGVDVTGEVSVPQTGNWQSWTTLSVPVTLEAGVQTMRMVVVNGGFNLNWFDVILEATSNVPTPDGERFTLHPAFPNPFNPATTIAYDLASPATVRLAVFDVAGQRVKTLVAGARKGAGRHEVTWNGRDDAGRLAPAGVYFYRLEADGLSSTRRMTLLK
jgi:beta-glucanase (GH16 family)